MATEGLLVWVPPSGVCRVRGGCGGCHFFPFFVMVMEVGEPGFGEVEVFAMLLIMTSARAPGGGAP